MTYRLRHLLEFLIVALIGLTLFRIGLLAMHFDRIQMEQVWGLLTIGLRFDLIVIGYVLVVPLFLSVLAPTSVAKALSAFLRVWYRTWFVILMAMEAIGIGFLIEYDHRPDVLFWEYLKYPEEVSQMLLRGYLLQILAVVVAVVLAYTIGKRLLLPRDLPLAHTARPLALTAGVHTVAFVLVAAILTMFIRSSFGHRPANVSSAQFSDNRLANELALNSTYTAGYARYARRYDGESSDLYGSMDYQEAIDLIMGPPSEPVPRDADQPTVHTVRPRAVSAPPRNVVIILEESLGARFVGSLGGADLTPNLDRLSKSGVLFTNLYATGTRTTRGIEAVVSGYPPSAAQSVVKRSKSRRDFFTLAQALKPHGYHSIFLYGGEANFDDMGGFMLGNGFDKVVAGAATYPNAVFSGSWGVSDEDWVRRAHREFEQASSEGPFFGLMLSTSNHSPWEFPSGRIEPGPGPLASRENSVRYADFALGEFFALAKQSAYFDNTVFLVVADHDARVYGDEFVPIDYFHIPGLLIAKDLPSTRYERIASQIDLLPTILPLLGVDIETPTIGQDLFAPGLTGPGRAVMQYGMNNALMRGDDVVVRVPRMPVRHFRRTAEGLQPAAEIPELARLSLAYLTLASELYERRDYRIGTVETAPGLTAVALDHAR